MLMESMEWTCAYCGGKGKVDYPAEKIEESTLIVCLHCSKPSAYVWCDNCGMGGQITETEFLNSPKSWRCMGCGSEYELSKDFYQTKIVFTPKRFLDLKRLTLKNDIKFQKHLPLWVKDVFAFWEKNRKYPLYLAIVSFFLGLIGTIIKDKYFDYDFLFYPMIFCFIVFFMLFGVDVILWMISKLFLLAYKFRKN
jgi:DNA-directed RNA polymerase subunit RPC12/RpoP